MNFLTRKAMISTLLGVIGVLLVGGVWYYFQSKPMLRNDYSAAKNALSSRDYTTAINLTKTYLSSASDPSEIGRSKLLLAESLWGRNQGDDQSQAIALYKEVVNDYRIPPVMRALALNDISIILNDHPLAYFQQNFSEPEFASLVPSSGTDAAKKQEAYFGLLRLSDETYPTSFAEYAIAGNYYVVLLLSKDTGSSTPAEIATLAQKYVNEGDSRNDQSLYSNFPLLKSYSYRAGAISVTGRILNNISLGDREAAFKRVIDTAAERGITATSSSYATVMDARFYYANTLLMGDPSRTADIVAILKPFSAPEMLGKVTGALASVKQNPKGQMGQNALKLAAISPDFKTYLNSIGVQ